MSSTEPIRIMLADDQALIRQGIRYVLDLQADMQVIAEAATGQEAIQLALQYRPHLILMDIQMPELSGIDATRRILSVHPDIKIILLTTFDVQDYVIDGIRAGASGYLLKDIDMNDMIVGIRSILAGGAIYNSTTAGGALIQLLGENESAYPPNSSYVPAPVLEPLTDRELEVLQAMAYGRRNFEIAEELYVSESTIKTHVHNIIQKLGVKDRTQAVVTAIRQQLVK